MKLKENLKKVVLEVDLEYPEELHESHNSYPLAPEKKAVGVEKMSEYQKRMMDDLGLDFPKSEKLVLTLEEKSNYVVHYKNLQFYHDQEPWMEPYIQMNTEFRKEAMSEFETNFYKLMNNSVFGKTMENLRNYVDVKIVRSWETDKSRRLVPSPSYTRHEIRGNDLASIHMYKTRLLLDKPIYTGMTILENSKILMYAFFYNQMKARYGQKCELIYTDTDSLLMEIETDDVYRDMAEDLVLYDTSNYPKEYPLYSSKNKKVLGKMKDECAGRVIDEAVAIRPKMYSIIEEKEKNIKKAKGVKKNVVEKEIQHEQYKEALFEKK